MIIVAYVCAAVGGGAYTIYRRVRRALHEGKVAHG